MLDPKEEQEIGECHNVVNGGDLEIIAMVQSNVGLARGDIEEIEEIDSDSDDDNLEVVPPSLKEMIEACRMLKENCLLFGIDSLDLVEGVRGFRGHLQKMRREATKQTTIDMYFNSK